MPAVQEPAGSGRPVVGGCGDSPRNCELLSRLNAFHVQTCQSAGIVSAEAILSAAAVGLVAEVWRHGPVESMHVDRDGPGNAAMFAESTALHAVALAALRAPDRQGGPA